MMKAVWLCTLLPCSGHATQPSDIERTTSSISGLRLSHQTPVPWHRNDKCQKSDMLTISIDPSQRFQTMRGFGASMLESGAINLNTLSTAKQEELLNLLFSKNGVELSALKAPIPSDDFFAAGPWYTYDDVDGDIELKHFSIERDLRPNGTLHFVKRAKEHGFDGYVQSYMDYPPDWMLKGKLPDHATVNAKYYDVLAAYYAKFVQAYAAHNVTIDRLAMFNEPVDSYTHITAEEMARLLGEHVGPLFDKLGLRKKTKLSSAGQATRKSAGEFVPAVMKNNVAKKYMDHIAYHGYDCQFNCSKERQNYDTIANLHKQWPELEVWMTEICYAYNGDDPNCQKPETMANCTDWPRNHSLASALPRFDFIDGRIWGSRIISDVAAGVSGWIYWNLILDMKGGPFLYSPSHNDKGANLQQAVVHVDTDKGTYHLTGLFWYLAHFSKFVRSGMHRIASTITGQMSTSRYVPEGTEGVEAVAFEDDSGKTVLQLLNHDDTETEIQVCINGQSARFKLPPISITTCSWQGQRIVV